VSTAGIAATADALSPDPLNGSDPDLEILRVVFLDEIDIRIAQRRNHAARQLLIVLFQLTHRFALPLPRLRPEIPWPSMLSRPAASVQGFC